MDELDFEGLDGDYFVHQNEMEKVRFTLISTGRLNEFNYIEDELREYIERELKVFSI